MSARTLIVLMVLFSWGSLSCIKAPPPHPRGLEANELCAQYLHLGDLERAEVQCDLGLQFAPQYGDLWTNKGNIALARGQESVAKEHYIKALRYNQEQAQAYMNLGFIYLKNRQYGRAHDNLQSALKVNPDYAEARYNLALTFIAMDRKEYARKELLTLTEVYPNLADPFARLGQLAFEEGNAGSAIEYFKQAIAIAPQYADAWLALGNAYMEAGQFTSAVHAFVSCIEANPNLPECPHNLSSAKQKEALTGEELLRLEETKGTEKTPESQYLMARTYKEKGLRNEEQRAYERCLHYDNKYPPCYYGLFEIYYDERNEKKASIACQNFLKFADIAESPREHEMCKRYLGDDAP
ncbi:MAG: tetratricopeptide repeat protein [Cystobacterineae bacterium]|nr:tetratricopeptide repeat protein [Cystobacterineae bacterium]